jgi:hypothetical protein
MKFFNFIQFLLTASVVFGQNSSIELKSPEFSFSLTTYNHAARIYDGVTTYELTNSFIKVSKTYLFDSMSKTVYLKRITKNDRILSAINRTRLDLLEDFYFNYCILATSGNEYFVNFVCDSTDLHISIHHYYIGQIDDIVQIINSKVPKKYRLHYLERDTKQDCGY